MGTQRANIKVTDEGPTPFCLKTGSHNIDESRHSQTPDIEKTKTRQLARLTKEATISGELVSSKFQRSTVAKPPTRGIDKQPSEEE